jgi:hypothetical protein
MKISLLLFFVLLKINLYSQYTQISDSIFEKALISLGYDIGSPDGLVLTSNISGIDSLSITPSLTIPEKITDLTGLQDFSSLIFLNCSGHAIHTVDFSQNTALKYLFFSENWPYTLGNAANLDFSGNPNLETIDLFYSTISSINLTQNLALTSIDASFNGLTTLDISENVSLKSVLCIENLLTSVSLPIGSTNLESIDFGRNELTQLDVSTLPNLIWLICFDNQLTCLNVKNGNPDLLVDASQNSNLTCIETDNPSSGMISADPIASLSTNCNNSCSSGTVGVSDLISKQLSLSVYPNPVTDEKIVVNFAYIESEIDVSLKNSIGQNIYKGTFNNTDVIRLPIDIPKGIYFLTVQPNSGIMQIVRVIKN